METKKLMVAALVSVVCLEPIRFNGAKYAPGSTITGLTEKQAEQLVTSNHAELVRRDFAAEQAAADKEAARQADAEKQAAADQAATDKALSDQAAARQADADQAASEQAAADQAEAAQAAADKAQADQDAAVKTDAAKTTPKKR